MEENAEVVASLQGVTFDQLAQAFAKKIKEESLTLDQDGFWDKIWEYLDD